MVRVLFHFNLFFYFFSLLQYPYPPPSIYSTYLLYFLFHQIYSLLHTNIPRPLLSLVKSIDPQLWTLLKSNHPPSVSQSPRRKFFFVFSCFFLVPPFCLLLKMPVSNIHPRIFMQDNYTPSTPNSYNIQHNPLTLQT